MIGMISNDWNFSILIKLDFTSYVFAAQSVRQEVSNVAQSWKFIMVQFGSS